MRKTLFPMALCLCFTFSKASSQNLVAGDIAFIGYNTDAPDGFSFIALKQINATDTLYFTDQGVSNTGNWNTTSEVHLRYIAPREGLSCGDIVSIIEEKTDSFAVYGGGSISMVLGSGFSMISGDQIIAYQGDKPKTKNPTFIAAIQGDYNPEDYDETTHWNTGSASSSERSMLPAGLTNGINAVALFPLNNEQDNAIFHGHLEGSAAQLREAINDYTNWTSDDSHSISILPESYIKNAVCSLTTEIQPLTEDEPQLLPYPNPIKTDCQLIGITAPTPIQLLDMSGRILLKKTLTSENNKIDMASMEDGIYFIQVTSKNKTKAFKIIKQ